MKYRNLGKYGVKVSELALGSWLTYGGSYGLDTTRACVKKAYDLGINHFDCADVYGYGQTHAGAAEEVLAEALKDYPRSSYVLTTKTFWPIGEGPNDRGLSRKHIYEACNASLKRLNTDYVDIFYCHRYDPSTPLEETMMALDDLVRQGKVLYIGVSEWNADQILDAVNITKKLHLNPIAVDQPCYNMLYRGIEKEVMPLCGLEGIGLTIWSPVAQGILTGKYKKGQSYPAGSRAADPKSANDLISGYLTDENLDKVEKLQGIANNLGIPMVNLALAWILYHKEVSSVLLGASKPEQLEQNIKSIDAQLDESIMREINNILG